MDALRVTPKLVVPDTDGQVAFLSVVLEAELSTRFTAGEAVVFAEVTLPGGGAIQLKDADTVDPAPPAAGGGVVLDIVVDDPDAVMALAVEHGAEVIFPVADQPYGARQGRFRGPGGHQWIVGTPIEWGDEQVQAGLDTMGG